MNRPKLTPLLAAGFFQLFLSSSLGADLGAATVTQVVREVNLLRENAAAVPASVGSKFGGNTAISTGRRSRAELEFDDSTLMRIGSSSVFSITGKRSVDLQRGALLLQTADGQESGSNSSRGVRVRAGGVTAAITGSMGLVSLSQPTEKPYKDEELFFKFISIHGSMRLELNGEFFELQPFQLLFLRLNLKGEVIGEPIIQTIDGKKLLASSTLLDGFGDQSRLVQLPIDENSKQQSQQKDANQWTAVTSGVQDRVPGLLRRGVIGINSLIRPPQPPVVMAPPPMRPPPATPRPAPRPVAPAPAPPPATPSPPPPPATTPPPPTTPPPEMPPNEGL